MILEAIENEKKYQLVIIDHISGAVKPLLLISWSLSIFNLDLISSIKFTDV